MGLLANQTAREGDFIQESGRSSTSSSDAGKVIKIESDGFMSGGFIANFGDGSDGTITLDGTNTYSSFMSKSGSNYTLLRNLYADNLTINATLITDGYLIFVKNTINGSGTLKWGTPNNGSNAAGQTGGAAAAQGGSGILKNTAGYVGGNGGPAGSGGGGSGQRAQQGGGVDVSAGIGSIGAIGGQGGIGGADVAASGGQGLIHAPNFKFGLSLWHMLHMVDIGADGVLRAYTPQGGSGSGSGGGGDNLHAGGGGGGSGASGGTIFIAARIWAGTFTISNVGGNAGNASNVSGSSSGGGGSGGNGGVNVVVYSKKTWTGSHTLTGGTKGNRDAGGVSGADGVAGTTGTAYEVSVATLRA